MASESGLGIIIAKIGVIKFLTLGAAGLGAALMAIFRPAKSRKELFYQAVVALSSSLLFGNTAASALANAISALSFTYGTEEHIQYLVSVHALVGAMSWGLFGGLAHVRDVAGSKTIIDLIKRK